MYTFVRIACASKRVTGAHGRGAGEGLAEKVGEGLVQDWRRAGGRFACTLQLCKSDSLECPHSGSFPQEPLNAPFLNGLFSAAFSRGKTAP